jgi:hypothetical protein
VRAAVQERIKARAVVDVARLAVRWSAEISAGGCANTGWRGVASFGGGARMDEL